MIRISTVAVSLIVLFPVQGLLAAPTVNNTFPMPIAARSMALGNSVLKKTSAASLAQQSRALVKLHRALMHGAISAKIASDFETRILQLNPLQEPEALAKIEASLDDCQSAPESALEDIGGNSGGTGVATKSAGTIVLQDGILSRIAAAVRSGHISKTQARQLRIKINGVCAEECQFVSREETVPPAVVAKDTRLLNSLSNAAAIFEPMGR